MPQGVFFRAVGPIGDTDTDALPVKEIGPAIGYYTPVPRLLAGVEGSDGRQAEAG